MNSPDKNITLYVLCYNKDEMDRYANRDIVIYHTEWA